MVADVLRFGNGSAGLGVHVPVPAVPFVTANDPLDVGKYHYQELNLQLQSGVSS